MKANRWFRLNRDDRAEVGVGTLIVFIAMVLVAAVAAAVLINTAGTLQDRAQRTGQEATEEVSSNLRVLAVYGEREGSPLNDYVTILKVHVQLASGAVPVDMSELVIRYSDGSTVKTYSHDAGAGASATLYSTSWVRGTSSDNVMRSGDLVELEFHLDSMSSEELQTNTNVELRVVAKTGAPANADFRSPSTWGDNTVITLR